VDFGVGGQINYGAGFNGSNSSISITDGGIGNNATARITFSVSLWIKTTTTSAAAIINEYDGVRYAFYLQTNTNGTLNLGNSFSGGGTFTSGTSVINDGDWHNLVLINNTSDSTQKLFIDGNNTPDINHTLNTGTKNANPIQVGYYATTAGYVLDGDIDQIRFFTSALSESQMDTLYAETACVHTATTTDNSYPVANTMYYKLDNSAVDEIGTSTATEQEMQYRFGKYGQAGLFNGVSNGSEINTNYTTGDTTLTHSIWMNQSGLGHDGFNVVLGAYWDGTTPYHLGYYMWTNATTITWVVFYGGDGGSTSQKVQASGTITQNQWHHIVATWTDGAGAKLYIDGDLAQSVSSSQTRNKNGINVAIGGFGHNRSNQANFKGLLDTYRYFNSELSASQVTQLYNEKPETDTSNFKAVLYDGTGGTDYISNVGMDLENDGGLIWFKERNGTNNYQLYDNVRGYDYALFSNLTDAQYNYSTHPNGDLAPASVEANGFFTPTVSNNGINRSGGDYVAWVFKAGGDAVSNSNGSVTSTVSANTAAGFSIVKWNGNGTTSQTVGHGLSSAPEIVIMKSLSSSAWYVLTTVISGTNPAYLRLDSTDIANSATFTSTSTTFTNFAYGGDTIAYCWHSVAGYSSIGSYEGNGSTDVTVSNVGFKPSWILVKNVDASASWGIFDNRRNTIEDRLNNQLFANTSDQESGAAATVYITVNNNGFVVNGASNSKTSASGQTYIYMAFK